MDVEGLYEIIRHLVGGSDHDIIDVLISHSHKDTLVKGENRII
jgi:hypothetical protein